MSRDSSIKAKELIKSSGNGWYHKALEATTNNPENMMLLLDYRPNNLFEKLWYQLVRRWNGDRLFNSTIEEYTKANPNTEGYILSSNLGTITKAFVTNGCLSKNIYKDTFSKYFREFIVSKTTDNALYQDTVPVELVKHYKASKPGFFGKMWQLIFPPKPLSDVALSMEKLESQVNLIAIQSQTEENEENLAEIMNQAYYNKDKLPKVIELLDNSKTNVNAKTEITKHSTLYLALQKLEYSKNQDLTPIRTIINKLLENPKTKINERTLIGTPILTFLLEKGEYNLVEKLLERRDLDVNATSAYKQPALKYALDLLADSIWKDIKQDISRDKEIIKRLLSHPNIDVSFQYEASYNSVKHLKKYNGKSLGSIIFEEYPDLVPENLKNQATSGTKPSNSLITEYAKFQQMQQQQTQNNK